MPPETGCVPVGGKDEDVPVKTALTFWLPPMLMEHMPVPLQAPDQPVNVEPEAGDAFSVTTDPAENDIEQEALQLRPEGDDVTIPEPLPVETEESV